MANPCGLIDMIKQGTQTGQFVAHRMGDSERPFIHFPNIVNSLYSGVSNRRGGGNRRGGVHSGQFSIEGGC